jgi:hypothetical protein
MALPPESAGSPVEVTHETLQSAAANTLPEQKSALGNTKQTVTSREVPAAAFSELGAEASAGHNRNIGQIADKMTGADKQYAAVIQGIGDTTKKFQDFDEEQARRQQGQQQDLELVAGKKKAQPLSENGWPIKPALKTHAVPGSSGTRLTFVDGPAGELMTHVAGQIQQRVESFDIPGPPNDPLNDGSYNVRPIGSGSTWSNHASGTAFDINSDLHPQHATGTWTPAQVAEIRTILGEVDGVVRWGGDFSPKHIDEMHFEIHATPAEVARVWDRIRAEIENTP